MISIWSITEKPKTRKDFRLSITFGKTNRSPLFNKRYTGSITGVSQFTFMVDKLKDYGYLKVGYILDRGYFNKGNIQYMDSNHFLFIIVIKGCKSLVSSLVPEHWNTLYARHDCTLRAYKYTE